MNTINTILKDNHVETLKMNKFQKNKLNKS